MKLQVMYAKKHSGFTLIEILVAVSLGIMVGTTGIVFGISSMARGVCGREFDGARAAVLDARVRAVVRGTGDRTDVSFSSAHPTITIQTSRPISFLSNGFLDNPETIHVSVVGPGCDKHFSILYAGTIL